MQTWTISRMLLQTLFLPAVLLLQQVRCHSCLKPASCATRTVSRHPGPLLCCPYVWPDACTGAAAQQQDSYQAVGLSYDGESAPETVGVQHEGEHFEPGFDVPTEHQHALRGMTDQQHKVNPPQYCTNPALQSYVCHLRRLGCT